MSVRDAVAELERRLATAGVESPRVDAELLIAHVLRTTRSGIYTAASELDPGELERLVRRREGREPLAYVLGEWGFRRLTVRTDARALVPRPETETVVERALELIRDVPRARVLDVGTGTGAIALAIADEHPGARVTAVDVSRAALELAHENATGLELDVELRHAGVEAAEEGWDLVVANPPYVRADELPRLQPELRHEPREALVDTGLHDELARRANTTWLVLEVADGQARDVARRLVELRYKEIGIARDLTGVERVVEGRHE